MKQTRIGLLEQAWNCSWLWWRKL